MDQKPPSPMAVIAGMFAFLYQILLLIYLEMHAVLKIIISAYILSMLPKNIIYQITNFPILQYLSYPGRMVLLIGAQILIMWLQTSIAGGYILIRNIKADDNYYKLNIVGKIIFEYLAVLLMSFFFTLFVFFVFLLTDIRMFWQILLITTSYAVIAYSIDKATSLLPPPPIPE